MTTGFTGSAHDSRVYANCALGQRPQDLFAPGEYVSADSAYVATPTVVPQYRRPKSNLHPYKAFVHLNDSIRIDAEHGFGILKGRFQSLCGLCVRIVNETRYRFAFEWITACCVLHDIFIHCDDTWKKD